MTVLLLVLVVVLGVAAAAGLTWALYRADRDGL
jgi:hypothetical protein